MLPSAPMELAWLLNLVVTSGPYAEPALAELDAALLPGALKLRATLREPYLDLWRDEHDGCPELVPAAHAVGLLDIDDLTVLWPALLAGTPRPVPGRLQRLARDASLRERYVDILRRAWRPAEGVWRRAGLPAVREICTRWEAALQEGAPMECLLLARHPLREAPATDHVVTPLFFCMSGGLAVDLGDHLRIGVPASAQHPLRDKPDAAFVADRAGVLSHPTRNRVLIQLLARASSVTELSSSLGLPQATVSDHVKVLRQAGLLQKRRAGRRSLYSGSLREVERVLEDARRTLAAWR